MDFINSIAAQLPAWFNVLTAVVAAASLIANLTPSDADNKVVAVLSKVVSFLALNFFNKAPPSA